PDDLVLPLQRQRPALRRAGEPAPPRPAIAPVPDPPFADIDIAVAGFAPDGGAVGVIHPERTVAVIALERVADQGPLQLGAGKDAMARLRVRRDRFLVAPIKKGDKGKAQDKQPLVHGSRKGSGIPDDQRGAATWQAPCPGPRA